MKITVTSLTDDIFNLEVSEDIELENFKALCEFECGIPATEISILWNGRPLLDEKKKLIDYGIRDGEIILLQRIQGARGQGPLPSGSGPGVPMINFGNIAVPGSGSNRPAGSSSSQGASQQPNQEDPETIRQILLSSPHDLAAIKERNPPLAAAINNPAAFAQVLKKQQDEKADRERERIRLLNADPFDYEAQQKIAEEIRLKNVESNMEAAMEYSPESFGQVVMLYIDCTVNGHPVKAFVDSGAQMTIMSKACAERCGIMRLVDRRWAGIAKGVGTQKIIGRVHTCQVQIEKDFLQTSFSILEEQPMDMLLGLDMLKRHQCTLNLKENTLVIGTTGTITRFLGEGDLPEHARNNRPPEDMDEDAQLAQALAKSADEVNTSEASTSGTSAPAANTPSFPEDKIQRLMQNGFTRAQVLEELTRANGDIDQALVALFARSFAFKS